MLVVGTTSGMVGERGDYQFCLLRWRSSEGGARRCRRWWWLCGRVFVIPAAMGGVGRWVSAAGLM